MTLASCESALGDPSADGTAVGAFARYDLDTASGGLAAAREREMPVTSSSEPRPSARRTGACWLRPFALRPRHRLREHASSSTTRTTSI